MHVCKDTHRAHSFSHIRKESSEFLSLVFHDELMVTLYVQTMPRGALFCSCCLFFETRLLCETVLPILQLTLQTRLALNSQ